MCGNCAMVCVCVCDCARCVCVCVTVPWYVCVCDIVLIVVWDTLIVFKYVTLTVVLYL